MKIASKFAALISFLLVALVLATSAAFTFWGGYFGEAVLDVSFRVGWRDGDYSNNPIDHIPVFVPDEIVDKLVDLSQIKDPDIMQQLIESVVNIYEYHTSDEIKSLHLAATADELFESGQPQINAGDYILFTHENENGEREVFVVHITENYVGSINSAEDIFQSISQSWTGVHLISPLWISGVLYTPFHAPVEYQTRLPSGEYQKHLYLNLNDGNRYAPPPQTLSAGTWFRAAQDLEYDPENVVYPARHIVKFGTDYYIARTAVWGTMPSASASWAWEQVLEWNGLAQASATVFTRETVIGQNQLPEEKIRFWTALESTSIPPSTDAAIQGIWQEVQNGWIGRRGDMVTKPIYFDHNTHSANQIVIYGVSANLQYRYYQAITHVPAGVPPLIINQVGQQVLNDRYWQRWN